MRRHTPGRAEGLWSRPLCFLGAESAGWHRRPQQPRREGVFGARRGRVSGGVCDFHRGTVAVGTYHFWLLYVCMSGVALKTIDDRVTNTLDCLCKVPFSSGRKRKVRSPVGLG